MVPLHLKLIPAMEIGKFYLMFSQWIKFTHSKHFFQHRKHRMFRLVKRLLRPMRIQHSMHGMRLCARISSFHYYHQFLRLFQIKQNKCIPMEDNLEEFRRTRNKDHMNSSLQSDTISFQSTNCSQILHSYALHILSASGKDFAL